jgi:hypothetical protein
MTPTRPTGIEVHMDGVLFSPAAVAYEGFADGAHQWVAYFPNQLIAALRTGLAYGHIDVLPPHSAVAFRPADDLS